MKKMWLLWVAVLAFSSCGISPEDIRFERLSKVNMEGTTLSQMRLTLGMEVANDSRVKVTVKEGNLILSDEVGDIAEVMLRESVLLPKRTTTEVMLPLTVRFRGTLGAVGMIPRLNGDPNRLKVSGTLVVKGSSVNRTFTVKDVPVQQFLNSIGIKDLKSLNLSF